MNLTSSTDGVYVVYFEGVKAAWLLISPGPPPFSTNDSFVDGCCDHQAGTCRHHDRGDLDDCRHCSLPECSGRSQHRHHASHDATGDQHVLHADFPVADVEIPRLASVKEIDMLEHVAADQD